MTSRGSQVEIVALDLNFYDSEIQCTWIGCTSTRCSGCNGKRCVDGYPQDGDNELGCKYAKCRETMQARAKEATKLLKARVEAAERSGTQLIVVS